MFHEQYHNKPSLKEDRQNLRNNATDAEQLLWKNLKGKKLVGRKFRRQHSYGNYILDFYCPSERLAIELDGSHHYTAEGKENDRIRDQFLKDNDIKVIRFSNSEVEKKMEVVLERIKANFR